MLDGRRLLYADLHSFYYESVQIFGQRLYDFESSRPDPLIIDCGAHIGLASLFFVTRYPSARVMAFEADPEIARLHQANMASYGAVRVTSNARAVWINDNGVNFRNSNDDSGHVVATGEGTIQVPSFRLRDLIIDESVEMLKLDIEGAEFAVLEDCDGALKNVEKMIIEVHKFNSDARVGRLLDMLEKNGFQYSLVDLHQATWLGSNRRPPFAACQTEKYLITVLAWR